MTTNQNYPRPTRIAKPDYLMRVWGESREIQKRKASGIDGVSPEDFNNSLVSNIDLICRDLINQNYYFSDLKPSFFEKGNGQQRVICVPTVKDRLVQRMILKWLTCNPANQNQRDLLRACTDISYGVARGRQSGKAAITSCLINRDRQSWVLKTDISSFFDNIPRQRLKNIVGQRLRNHSLVPLIHNAIDCEIRETNPHQRQRINNLGIRRGRGLRQGMPLSPLLANAILYDFDNMLINNGINAIRYIDDIICFANSEEECINIFNQIRTKLRSIGCTIPHYNAENTKTRICSPHEPVIFLGVEIIRKSNGKYTRKIPEATINASLEKLRQYTSLDNCLRWNLDYAGVCKRLDNMLKGYISQYNVCKDTNYTQTLRQWEHEIQNAKRSLLTSTLGEDVFNDLGDENKSFLGISI